MSDELDTLTGDEKIVQEAKDRFALCQSWESDARNNWLNDTKFANADAYNQWQWPNKIATDRVQDNRPCLTVNKTQQHCLQIINDAKKNKPGVAVRAVSDASFEAANVWMGLVRHIEYQSKATQAYMKAVEGQVQGGIGYWRVQTKYVSDEVFDQDAWIVPINNALSVYLDPDIQEFDGLDARYGFIFDDVPKDLFKQQYPRYKDIAGMQNVLSSTAADNWVTQDHIRVAEYYRKVSKPDRLFAIQDQGVLRTVRASELPPEVVKRLKEDKTIPTRETTQDVIEWYKIAGDKIIDRTIWPGKYVPIIRCVGIETVIEKRLDRKGHVRAMLDPQRIYNYWTSSAVEQVALQGKTPWVAPAESIEGFETYWQTANTVNHSVLPYNAYGDDGQILQHKPERAEPPQMAQAYIQGLQISSNELMAVSGQYQAQLGQQGNERSKAAIQERNREGDNATYHFIDHLGVSIEATGRVLLDLLPKIYDTKRVITILNEDGTDTPVTVDPNAQQAYQAKVNEITKVVSDIVLNPRKGKFAVRAEVGKSWGTKRQESVDAFATILTQSPQLAAVIGDLMLRSMDFPLAQEAAERLKRMVPPQALGQGPSEQEKMLQMQVQSLSETLAKALEDLGKEKRKSESKDQLRLTDAFDAETRRLGVLKDYLITQPQEMAKVVKDTLKDALGIDLDAVKQATLPGLGEEAHETAVPMPRLPPANMAPHPAAKQGPDGHWYLPDERRPGKFLKVMADG